MNEYNRFNPTMLILFYKFNEGLYFGVKLRQTVQTTQMSLKRHLTRKKNTIGLEGLYLFIFKV